jgi:hypothetical protein
MPKSTTLAKRQATRTYRLLKFIGEHPEGLRANDIKKWIFEDIYPNIDRKFDPIEDRGIWATNLYGSVFDRYCKKANGKWHLAVPLPDDLRAPLYYSPNAEFAWGPSHYHTVPLGGNLYTITPEEKASRLMYKNDPTQWLREHAIKF